MDATNELKQLLADLSGVYNDGEAVDVCFGDAPTAIPPGEYDPAEGSHAPEEGRIYVNPTFAEDAGLNVSGPNELRLLINTVSHEVEHLRESPTYGKRDMGEAFPEAPKLAATVANIVEDQFIDWHRCTRFRGLRRTDEFETAVIIGDDEFHPPLDELESRHAQAFEGLVQVAFVGYAKQIDAVDDDIQRFLAWAGERIDSARYTLDGEERMAVAEDIIEELLDLIDPLDADAMDELEQRVETTDAQIGGGTPEEGDGDAGLTIEPGALLTGHDVADLRMVD